MRMLGDFERQRRLAGKLRLWCFAFLQTQQLALPASVQILAAGHPEQIKLDKLQHPAVGTPPAVELQEQSGDEGEINFNGHPAGGLRQPMPTTQNAFDPAEEQFDAPTLVWGQSGHQFGGISSGSWLVTNKSTSLEVSTQSRRTRVLP